MSMHHRKCGGTVAVSTTIKSVVATEEGARRVPTYVCEKCQSIIDSMSEVVVNP